MSTAQTTIGAGSLDTIEGSFFEDRDVDLYCINITDTETFAAILVCTAIADNDLWLFDASGFGVAANDGCQFSATNITDQFVVSTGIHLLGVSASDAEATSSGGEIWSPPSDTGETAPDGPGATASLSGWNYAPAPPTQYNYSIQLTGSTFCDGPVANPPTTWGRVKTLY